MSLLYGAIPNTPQDVMTRSTPHRTRHLASISVPLVSRSSGRWTGGQRSRALVPAKSLKKNLYWDKPFQPAALAPNEYALVSLSCEHCDDSFGSSAMHHSNNNYAIFVRFDKLPYLGHPVPVPLVNHKSMQGGRLGELLLSGLLMCFQ